MAAFAQPGDRSRFIGGDEPVAHPNFDIRTYVDDPAWPAKADAAEYLRKFGAPELLAQDLAVTHVSGVARLEAEHPGVVIENNAATRGVELVTAPAGRFLTAPSGDRVTTLRGFLSVNAAAYGVTAAQVGDLEVVADYMNPAGNMGYAEFEQRFHGIPVFQGLIRGGFTARGELSRTTGLLAQGIDASMLTIRPSLSAAQAVSMASDLVGWAVPEASLVERPSTLEGHVQFGQTGIAGEPSAWLVYFPLAPGVARLAWATQLLGDPDGYLIVLDAGDGTMLFRKNLTNYQTQPATYNVYTSDSPAPSSPTPALPGANFQAPTVARQTVTLIGNEPPFTFNNLGWINDNTNLTEGNNVQAGLDLVSPEGMEFTTIVTGSPNRTFSHDYNPAPGSPAPGDDPATAAFRNGEVVNLFYWTNRFHDLTYLYGFTEAARNFQDDNFGRGGYGFDRIQAEGQDYSGLNNANFQTGIDLVPGRMQMYIFTAGSAVNRSSGIDQDVILHELTHGLSNRLHNNASGLGGSIMSGGMGEGWSDFYARALLSTASENVNGVYAMGGWVTHRLVGNGYTDNYYYGIRRFPYAVLAATGGPSNRPFNPLTFADIDPAQIDLTDGAYPRGPIGSDEAYVVHNVGEVWASALFEVRARFITRLGFTEGNRRILQFVTDGMKLDPVNPTMPQGRDAILAAAGASGNDPADVADIWAGFAARGLGVLAEVVNIGGGTVIESFLTPTDPATPRFSIGDLSQAEGNAGTTTFTFTVTLANPTGAESRVSFVTGDGSATEGTTFTANTPVTIPIYGPASTYPVPLNVSGLAGTITSVAVQIEDLSHGYPPDLDLLLVGPGGERSMLLSDVGGNFEVIDIDVTFRDGATPAPSNAQLRSGAYAPTDYQPGDVLPAPAPAGPYQTPLSVFNGTNPNGTWNLYLADDACCLESGSLAGYSLLITTTAAPGDYRWTAGQLVFPPGTTSVPVAVTVIGDTAVEPNETLVVNLSAPTRAVVGDGQGVGTIINDDSPPAAVPTSVSDAYTTAFHTPLSVAAPGVLANDSTNGGGVMSAALVSGPTNGTLALAPDGSFVYTPNFAFVGPDSFSYRAVNLVGSGNMATVTLTVTPPTTVQPPNNLRVDSVVGNVVTLRWDTMPIGPQAVQFILEGGVLPGEVLASFPTGSPSPIFTFVAPSGSFFIRMHGELGGDRSGASNEVSLHVNVPVAPSAPVNLLGLVNGDTVDLAWKNTFEGGPATGLVLDVTGSLAVSVLLGVTERFNFTPVPGGTYTFRVRQTNPGGSSAPSDPVTLSFPAVCSGAPGMPANFLGYRVGNTAYVVWDPPAAGPTPTSYLLDVAGGFAGSFATSDRTLSGVVGPGSYEVRVMAVNACGVSTFTPVQVITVP
jgi:Fungalysin metallopeptidase (M36)/Bacterial Ig domain/Calx-beta domain